MYADKSVCKYCGEDKLNIQGEGWTCLNETCPQYSKVIIVDKFASPKDVISEVLFDLEEALNKNGKKHT